MVRVDMVQAQTHSTSTMGENLKILVVDDHPVFLTGTLNILSHQFPNAEIHQAKPALEVYKSLENLKFDLILMDLSIPKKTGDTASTETGIQLLQQLLQDYPMQNFVAQTSYVKALVRIRHDIDNHQGGFAIADKTLSESEMLVRLNLALKGATHTREIRTGIELKPDWLEVLRLAFEEGLTDKGIAERMFKSERAIRTYWTKIQDVLGVYPEDCKQNDKNLRIQTKIHAREEGLID